MENLNNETNNNKISNNKDNKIKKNSNKSLTKSKNNLTNLTNDEKIEFLTEKAIRLGKNIWELTLSDESDLDIEEDGLPDPTDNNGIEARNVAESKVDANLPSIKLKKKVTFDLENTKQFIGHPNENFLLDEDEDNISINSDIKYSSVSSIAGQSKSSFFMDTNIKEIDELNEKRESESNANITNTFMNNNTSSNSNERSVTLEYGDIKIFSEKIDLNNSSDHYSNGYSNGYGTITNTRNGNSYNNGSGTTNDQDGHRRDHNRVRSITFNTNKIVFQYPCEEEINEIEQIEYIPGESTSRQINSNGNINGYHINGDINGYSNGDSNGNGIHNLNEFNNLSNDMNNIHNVNDVNDDSGDNYENDVNDEN